MIITRTPLRISLFGGGTDLPEFFSQSTGGVVSFTINKYIYISINEKFNKRTRVSYSKAEEVDEPRELEHDLVREALKFFNVKGVEITSVSDIPGEGSGLGSSSAFTVGLIRGWTRDASAETAYYIERNLCGHPVGKQDHYAAAWGGLNYFQFNTDDSVDVEPIPLTQDLRWYLEKNIMLFWTGVVRHSRVILNEQAKAMNEVKPYDNACRLVEYAREARRDLKRGDFGGLGVMLDESWYYKKSLATVTTEQIDTIYSRAKLAGAQGGKVCGAGGGGFLIFIADPRDQDAVEKAVGLRRVPFEIEEKGSKIIYQG